MIEHHQSLRINAPNARVWDYVSVMANWASNMPGYQSFDIVNDKESLWTLKIGVGALVRTIRVRVVIQQWDEPYHVSFTFRLDNDPVDGDGAYQATIRSGGITDVEISFRVTGRGPMSAAWEAMMRPILPKMAKGFGDTLTASIEQLAAQPTSIDVIAPPAQPGPLARVSRKITAIFCGSSRAANAKR
jgi:carbon monoxide dehydrogenase subunit G